MTAIRRPDGSAGELPEGSVLIRCGTSKAGTAYRVIDGELVELSLAEVGAMTGIPGFHGSVTAVRSHSWENDIGLTNINGVRGQTRPDHD